MSQAAWVVFVWMLALGAMCLAEAHDDEHDQWFDGLMVPGTGNSESGKPGWPCCHKDDCKPVQSRIGGRGRWEVLITSATFPDNDRNLAEGRAPNGWVIVPEEAILHGKANPIGEAVACWYQGHVRCFVPGAET